VQDLAEEKIVSTKMITAFGKVLSYKRTVEHANNQRLIDSTNDQIKLYEARVKDSEQSNLDMIKEFNSHRTQQVKEAQTFMEQLITARKKGSDASKVELKQQCDAKKAEFQILQGQRDALDLQLTEDSKSWKQEDGKLKCLDMDQNTAHKHIDLEISRINSEVVEKSKLEKTLAEAVLKSLSEKLTGQANVNMTHIQHMYNHAAHVQSLQEKSVSQITHEGERGSEFKAKVGDAFESGVKMLTHEKDKQGFHGNAEDVQKFVIKHDPKWSEHALALRESMLSMDDWTSMSDADLDESLKEIFPKMGKLQKLALTRVIKSMGKSKGASADGTFMVLDRVLQQCDEFAKASAPLKAQQEQMAADVKQSIPALAQSL